MLQVSSIEKEFDRCAKGLQKRGLKESDTLLRDILKLNDQRKKLQSQLDEILHESNILTKKIGQLLQQNEKENAMHTKSETLDLKQKSKVLSKEISLVKSSITKHLYSLPNIPHESVLVGESSEDNEVIKVVDTNIPKMGKYKEPHWELIEKFDIIDFETGNKVSGAGFPFYKKQGAQLVRGIINYCLNKASEAGYDEIQPPIVINEASGIGTGQLPDKEEQMYHIQTNDLYLIPTAEVPITNMYRDMILKEDHLPIKHVSHTPCFRREAGSWGSHVRGLNRLHQFDKVEIVQIVRPTKSYEVLDQMVTYVESLIQSLELPYRILRLCTGDLGFASALTYDFEVYSVAQEKWLEVSSVSNFETFQANRLKLRVKNTNHEKELLHTLNGSALALPRIIAALLENNQYGDHIKIPNVLHPYLSFKEIRKS